MEEFIELTGLDHAEADAHRNRWCREAKERHMRTLTNKTRRATEANLASSVAGALLPPSVTPAASREASERFIIRRIIGRMVRLGSQVLRPAGGSTTDLGPAVNLPPTAAATPDRLRPPDPVTTLPATRANKQRVTGYAPAPKEGLSDRVRGRLEGLAAGAGLGALLGCGVLLLALNASGACFDGR